MNPDTRHESAIRPAAVAGHFYPSDATELRQMVNSYLTTTPNNPPPKAIIAPHAGYVYSGAVAGSAYTALSPRRGQIKRVILLGPAHRVYLKGLALCSAGEFATPLGNITVDNETATELRGHPDVCINDAAHAGEHSLEVHLPFLQVMFDDFRLVPLVVGDAAPGTVADVLERIWGGDETLVVISSDLSHYHAYELANEIDRDTAQAIESFELQRIGPHQACGCMPLNGLLKIAREKSMQIVNYDLRNSGDTAGDRQRVVGYGAWGLY
ncbi:MAG: AmmeMemoRadiSam system protein B [Thiotrichales bacterium]|nr:AmmeMemoRadiSam system protein B [Thiotrichales bacterium]